MTASLTGAALSAYRRLPRRLRRLVVHAVAPSYAVGAVAVVTDEAGAVLLLRERHHDGWGLPGGLLQRKEGAAHALARELGEELGLQVDPDVLDPPNVYIDAEARRVDVVFRLALPAGDPPTGRTPEVLEARWFDAAELPPMFPPAVDALTAAGYDVTLATSA